ncbi:MAG: hypothetical protein ACKOT0_12600, partial [bacterium]
MRLPAIALAALSASALSASVLGLAPLPGAPALAGPPAGSPAGPSAGAGQSGSREFFFASYDSPVRPRGSQPTHSAASVALRFARQGGMGPARAGAPGR